MGTVTKYSTPGGREGYVARDSWTDPATGERRHKKRRFHVTYAMTLTQCKREAEAWLAQREADRSRGLIWEPSRETLGSLLDRWADGLAAPLSGRTIIGYRTSVRCRFDRESRAWRVGELTPGHIRRLLGRWQREGLSDDTIQGGWVVLKQALALARAEQGIQHDPMAGVRRKRTPRPATVTWAPDQVRAFLEQTRGDHLGHVWALLFASCCRIGELCALQWSDIDLDSGVVTIRRTWSASVTGPQRMIVERTKTGQTRRVPIPADVVAWLRLVRDRTPDDVWLIEGDHGAMTTEYVRKRWNASVAASGLPVITPHDARHSGATNMIAAGVPVAVVSRILGHADVAMTLRRYVHPGEDDATAAMEVLGSLYRGDTDLSKAHSAPRIVPITKKTG